MIRPPKLTRRESAGEADVAKWWRGLGHVTYKIKGDAQRGAPDRLFMIPRGRPLFIEFKREKKTPTTLQLYEHQRLRDEGYDVEVHDNKHSAIASLQRRLDAAGLPEDRR